MSIHKNQKGRNGKEHEGYMHILAQVPILPSISKACDKSDHTKGVRDGDDDVWLLRSALSFNQSINLVWICLSTSLFAPTLLFRLFLVIIDQLYKLLFQMVIYTLEYVFDQCFSLSACLL